MRPQRSHTGPPSPGAGPPAVPGGGNEPETPETQLWRACAELSRRLRRGEPGSAEQFLAEYPTLAEHEDLAVDLICFEFGVRRELGQRPRPEDWYARFPQWHDRLREEFANLPPLLENTTPGEATAAEAPPAQRADPLAPPVAAPGFAERYELQEELGRGGMGVVYKARDRVLDRPVALKMIRSRRARPDEVLRFRREAQAVARLRHRHIVALHDFGEHDGEPFLTMAYVSGGNLSRRIGDFGDPRAAVTLMEKVARAVEAAHAAGIVHRDLKPANVLLDEEGEPLVSDFGLAKFLDPGPGEDPTYTGQLVGTPAYMAPEQAAGHGHRATPATDVWALGVILYELLTGCKPFRGEGAEVAQRIQQEAPAAPRALRPGLDRALETVVLKCLEKEPARRYASAGPLADDLGRWLRGEAIAVRPEEYRRKCWRVLRRAPAARLVLAALLLLLGLVGGLLLWSRLNLAPTSSPGEDGRSGPVALRALQDELAAGSPVTLLEPAGLPRYYYRWRTEKHRPRLPLSGKNPLAIESWATCLLELVPDPQRSRYRLSAEVMHRSTNNGWVGLYFVADEHATRDGPEQRFGTLAFAEQGESAGNVRMDFSLYREGEVNQKPLHARLVVQKGRFDVPAEVPSWHALAVEVTPEKITTFWDGRVFHQWVRAERLAECNAWWARQHPPPHSSPPPGFSPRGSAGLYVNTGAAWFRNVVVSPL
jgi:hypothetical protein